LPKSPVTFPKRPVTFVRNTHVFVQQLASALPAFDMPASEGDDLRQRLLDERKEILRDTFDDDSVLIYVGGIIGAGEWVFEQAQKLDLDGMMAKRLDSTYQAGRSRDWQKVKNMAYSRPAALGFGRAS
jgi:bifunctional non-homologous end joining protein LigD